MVILLARRMSPMAFARTHENQAAAILRPDQAMEKPRDSREENLLDVEGPAQEARLSRLSTMADLGYPAGYPEASGALQEIHMCESARQRFWHVQS
jgi:hypothetical protein